MFLITVHSLFPNVSEQQYYTCFPSLCCLPIVGIFSSFPGKRSSNRRLTCEQDIPRIRDHGMALLQKSASLCLHLYGRGSRFLVCKTALKDLFQTKSWKVWKRPNYFTNFVTSTIKTLGGGYFIYPIFNYPAWVDKFINFWVFLSLFRFLINLMILQLKFSIGIKNDQRIKF